MNWRNLGLDAGLVERLGQLHAIEREVVEIGETPVQPGGSEVSARTGTPPKRSPEWVR